MAATYILYSARIDRYYVGSCNVMSDRIQQHLTKTFKNSYTAKANDWIIFWYEDCLTEKQARGIESHLKKMRSRKYLESLKLYPEIFEKLKAMYS